MSSPAQVARWVASSSTKGSFSIERTRTRTFTASRTPTEGRIVIRENLERVVTERDVEVPPAPDGAAGKTASPEPEALVEQTSLL